MERQDEIGNWKMVQIEMRETIKLERKVKCKKYNNSSGVREIEGVQRA